MIDIGYCTNVFPGTSCTEVEANLRRYAEATGARHSSGQPAAVGLWLSESAVMELADARQRESLIARLAECRLRVQTLNGFPQGDFHQPVVKHRVYFPDWRDRRRLEFTQRLAESLVAIIGSARRGSISTLPVAWRHSDWSRDEAQCAARHLVSYSEFAADLESRTGVQVTLCIEPEPGCVLGTSREAIEFLDNDVLRIAADERQLRRYLGICHDVCHAAVMFEPQGDALDRYFRAGWDVAKVQISSALVADFRERSPSESETLARGLASYAEPRYLHQTCVGGRQFFDDLPVALAQAPRDDEWRIHFHVPVFQDELPHGLATTQSQIAECVRYLAPRADAIHWELETYAWNVLPVPPAPGALGGALARELDWFHDLTRSIQTGAAAPEEAV